MNKKILPIVGGLAIAIGLIWSVRHFKQQPQRTPPPSKSAEQILQDRANLGEAYLKTALGQLIVNKNWEEFKKQYDPSKKFLDFSEIVRGLYSSGAIKKFSIKDQNLLMGIALDTVQKMDKRNYPLAGLLFTQILRLPPPAHQSHEYKTIESWLKDSDTSPILKKVAIQKLVLQDGSPESKYVQMYIHGFKTSFLNMSRTEYIAMADDIRAPKVRKLVFSNLLKEFKSLEKAARPAALIVLAKNLEDSDPKTVRHYAFAFLKGENTEEFESALRAIPYLYETKALSPEDRQKIVKRLDSVPAEVKTPFVELKAQEIIQLFSKHN